MKYFNLVVSVVLLVCLVMVHGIYQKMDKIDKDVENSRIKLEQLEMDIQRNKESTKKLNDMLYETNIQVEEIASRPTQESVATDFGVVEYSVSGGYEMVMEMTAYTASADECGSDSGITASGTIATSGRTVACNSLPFGTVVYIEGIGERIVEDRGGMGDGVIDLFVDTKDEAFSIGRRIVTVTVLG